MGVFDWFRTDTLSRWNNVIPEAYQPPRLVVAVTAILAGIGVGIVLVGGGTDLSVQAAEGVYQDRDYERELQREYSSYNGSHEVTVVALGDSFTAGFGLVSREYAWPSVLERTLHREGIDAEVLNLGERATGIEDHADKFVKWAGSHDPDIVLLQIEDGDFIDHDRAEAFVEQKLAQYNNSSNIDLKKLRVQLWDQYTQDAQHKSGYKTRRFRTHLNRIYSAAARNTSVYIFLNENRLNYLPSFLRTYTKEKNWTYVNWERFWEAEAEKEAILLGDGSHYNRRGNRIWAEELYQYLLEEGAFSS